MEDVHAISTLMHDHQALSIVVVTELLSLGLLKPPGELGVDIVTGEAQSFGIPPSFGGPILGFMACKQKYLRQQSGRLSVVCIYSVGLRCQKMVLLQESFVVLRCFAVFYFVNFTANIFKDAIPITPLLLPEDFHGRVPRRPVGVKLPSPVGIAGD